jgi:predicted transcriptional regulator
MNVHLNPDLQAKLERWTAETGRSPEELIEEAMDSYFVELAHARESLDRRYDELRSGRTHLIDGADVLAQLRRKSEARRGERRE